MNKKNLFQLVKPLYLQDYANKRFVNMLMNKKSFLTKLHPDLENSMSTLFNKCLQLWMLVRILVQEEIYPLHFKKQILFMLESHPESNWMIFKDRSILLVQNANQLSFKLFRMLVLELTLNEKGFKKFWTPVYKKLSEKLLLPIETDYADSDTSSLKQLSKNQEENFIPLMKKNIKRLNKNYPKTYWQLSTSSVVDKWEEENMEPKKKKPKLESRKKIPKLKIQEQPNDDNNNEDDIDDDNERKLPNKSLTIQLFPTEKQKEILDGWLDTTRYIYNKVVQECETNSIEERNARTTSINFQSLRDKFITENTRKCNAEYQVIADKMNELKSKKIKGDNTFNDIIDSDIRKLKLKQNKLPQTKNPNVLDWELKTPKETRAFAVKEVVTSYKSCFTKLKKNMIKFFKIGFRKKTTKSSSMQFQPNQLKFNEKRQLILMPHLLKSNKEIKYGNFNRKFKNIQIHYSTKIIKNEGRYFINIPYLEECQIKSSTEDITFCGIDPGVRDFMTVFGNEKVESFSIKQNLFHDINLRIRSIKNGFVRKKRKKLLKLERRKSNLINEVHHKVINDLVKSYDVIFYGDIKSHDIVRKNNVNSRLNRDMNDMKFYKFKERLVSKVKAFGKKIFLVDEAYTSQTCSSCGTCYKIGKSKTYDCSSCNVKFGRDLNGAKNILMKGIFENYNHLL